MGMRLEDDGAGADDFPTLAPLIVRSADLLKATMRSRQRLQVWECPLAGSLSGSIDFHHHPLRTSPIKQATGRGKRRARKPLLLKERPQGLRSGLIQGREKADKVERWGNWLRPKRAMNGEAEASKSFVKSLQGRFARDGIAK
jgi:hypothetical protein